MAGHIAETGQVVAVDFAVNFTVGFCGLFLQGKDNVSPAQTKLAFIKQCQ